MALPQFGADASQPPGLPAPHVSDELSLQIHPTVTINVKSGGDRPEGQSLSRVGRAEIQRRRNPPTTSTTAVTNSTLANQLNRALSHGGLNLP
jgi:hypothetical protein